ncbi:MAG: hypothetical protein D6675_06700 [Gemmatimonadetes bacterium]|nr:MAG: hypothetical protein D6675_06700 [Gemmatimonadota bacterium]
MKKFIVYGLVALLIPTLSFAKSKQAPSEKTGAPGQKSCVQCHKDNDVNSGKGKIVINAPQTFEAGKTYPITIELVDPQQMRWGFQLTTLGAGTLSISDSTHTQLAEGKNDGFQYVGHTKTGTFAGQKEMASWTFNWTAPAETKEVTFYAAGNAANNNEKKTGDFIYISKFISKLAESE